jgi:dihydroneopterin aldolase
MTIGGKLNSPDKLILRLDDMALDMSIGVYPWEKFAEHPNRLKISVELHADVPPGPLASHPIIDYARIYHFLRALPGQGHIDLLETLADMITEQCFVLPRVEAARVKILKTSLLPDCGGAGIDVFRNRQSWLKVSA